MIRTLFLLIFCTFTCFAQSNQDKAKAYFVQAQSNYDSGSYQKSIENLDKVKELLGSSNPMTLSLRFKSYYQLKDFANAKKYLNLFFRKGSNASKSLKDEATSFIIKIDEALDAEKKRIEKERLAEIERKKKLREKRRRDSIRAAKLKNEQEIARIKKEKEKTAFRKYYTENYPNSNENIVYFKEFDNGEKIYGVVDKNFNVLLDFNYSEIEIINDRLAYTKSSTKEYYGLIDIKRGVELFPLFKNNIVSLFDETGTAIVDFGYNDGSAVINSRGEIIIKSDTDMNFKFYKGVSVIKKNNKYGLIRRNGSKVTPIKYESMGMRDNGLVIFKEKFRGRMNKGIMNYKGELILELNDPKAYFEKFDDKNEVIYVSGICCGERVYENASALYDYQGNTLRAYKKDEGYGEFSEGLATICVGKKLQTVQSYKSRRCGYMNNKGDIVIPIKYWYASKFVNGQAQVRRNKKGGRYFKIDKSGKKVK